MSSTFRIRSRHRKPSRERLVFAAAGLALLSAGAGLFMSAPAAATDDTLSGAVFKDLDRNGVHDAGEEPWVGLSIQAFDATTGAYVGAATTDSAGRYAIPGLSPATYRVALSTSDWWSLRESWVLSDLSSLRMERMVTISGGSTADLPLRPIVKSTTVGEPVTRFAGPNGPVVESYNDAVRAEEIYDALARGFIGVEGPAVVTRFGLTGSSTTSASVAESNGMYSNYKAIMSVSYVSWLDGLDSVLSHEYGHAWSLYHAYTTQRDPTLAAYVKVRGLEGDARLGSSYAWYPRELIADDFRQLFGSATARATSPLNREIPRATEVEGLRDFLTGAFLQAPDAAPTPAPTSASELVVDGPIANPAPVTRTAEVSFKLSEEASVSLTLADARGKLVRTFFTSIKLPSGVTSIAWDRKDSSGRRVKSGTYTLRLVASAGGQIVSTQTQVSVA
jgi:hypothetical protein